jgi:hypothetical protein
MMWGCVCALCYDKPEPVLRRLPIAVWGFWVWKAIEGNDGAHHAFHEQLVKP